MAAVRTATATIKVATSVTSITSNTLTSIAGQSLFAAWSYGASGTPSISAINDSKGNTWTNDVEFWTGGLGVGIISCKAPTTVGSGHTVQVAFSGAGGDAALGFCQYSGMDNVAVLGTNHNTATGTAASSGAVAPGVTAIYLIALNYSGSDTTITPNSPWGQIVENETGVSAQPLNFSEQLNVSGSQNGSWTLGASRTYYTAIAAYQVASSATQFIKLAGHGGLAGPSSVIIGPGGLAGKRPEVDFEGRPSRSRRAHRRLWPTY